ncbi:sensor histidine kinase, partial [Clostridium neonatale]
MKTELISNVSHDLKTPLTSIITYVDLLKNPEITEEERKSYIDTLDKKSQRLKFLIEDLFEVSKATSGNIKLNLVKVDIVELMRQTQIE